jgi:hypothetical protein
MKDEGDKRNLTISRASRPLYDELVQTAGEQHRPVANLIRNILADCYWIALVDVTDTEG